MGGRGVEAGGWIVHTRVCLGDGLRVVVAEAVPDGRDDGHHDGAGAAYDAGPEEGGTLARCPAPVAEGLLPEEGRSAGHFVTFCEGWAGQSRLLQVSSLEQAESMPGRP